MNIVYSVITSILFSINLSSDIPYSAIEKSFEANNAREIVVKGKSKILINVLGKEGVYSQPQATLVLKDFFTKYPGNRFTYTFKGKEDTGGTFSIANYITKKDEKFRVVIFLKKSDSKFRIESLTIERA